MYFKDLRDQVLRLIDEADDTGTTLAIVKDLMNQAHQQRVSERPWRFMRWDMPVALTTTAGQKVYTLHQEFGRPWYFKDSATNQYIVELPTREIDSLNFLDDPTGVTSPVDGPLHFYFSGHSQVKQQPESVGALTLVSSSALDVSDYYVYLTGEDSSGDVFTETVVLTGTTPVTTTNSYRKIVNIAKGIMMNGNLTIKDSDSNVLLVLRPTEVGKQYRQITFLEDPGTRTITYGFYKQASRLQNDNDIPLIPAPYSQVLVWDTLLLLAGGYLTDVSGQQLSVWQAQQKAWEWSLHNYEMEGQTAQSKPQSVRMLKLE